MQHEHNLDLTPVCEKWNMGLTLMNNTTHNIIIENRKLGPNGPPKKGHTLVVSTTTGYGGGGRCGLEPTALPSTPVT